MAEVVLHYGRFFLVVNDVYLAMQGDICRGSSLRELADHPDQSLLIWSFAMLDEAAMRINHPNSKESI